LPDQFPIAHDACFFTLSPRSAKRDMRERDRLWFKRAVLRALQAHKSVDQWS
jgi:hypothetical protein